MSFLVNLSKSKVFLSTMQNMGLDFSISTVEHFYQGKVLFVQAANNFFHAAKIHFMQL
jgi:hypothetical protein